MRTSGIELCLFVCLSYTAIGLTDAVLQVFCFVVVPRPFLFRSRVGAHMAAHISLHTLVSFVMKPRRTSAVPMLNLLGEQRSDV